MIHSTCHSAYSASVPPRAEPPQPTADRSEQPDIQEELHGTSQPPAKRLTPIADRMRARETLAERDIFEANLEMQMVRKGKIEELPSGERGGGGGGCDLITLFLAVVVPYIPPEECLFRSLIFTLLVGWE